MKVEVRSTLISAVFVGAVGCNPSGLDEARHATGSQTVVASSDYRALYVANVDEGTVSRVDPTSNQVSKIEVGLEPTRIARAGSRVFVTLRNERAVAVLTENGSSLSLETKIEVGAEPFGIVANEKGDRVYVASSLSNRIDEIDAEGLTILRSFPMPFEPRWLGLHPSNGALYVGSPVSTELLWVDLGTGDVTTTPLPEQSTITGSRLTPRITGDIAVSADGYNVVVPGLYVDNITSIDDSIPPPPSGYYGGGVAGGGSRLTPVLFVIPAGARGEPLQDYSFSLLISGRDFNGYPASATFDPSGDIVYTPIEGGAGVIATSITIDQDGEGAVDKFFDSGGGIAVTPFTFAVNPIQGVLNAGAGARSIAFLDDQRAFVHSFIDNRVTDVRPATVSKLLRDEATRFGGNAISAGRQVTVAEDTLPEDVSRGRRLFYASNEPRMSATFTGLSCSACHFDGRNDGLTWTFNKGSRQTPSLAGKISVTAPVRWQGDRATVQEDAMRTSRDAMGGNGIGAASLTELDLNDIAAYVDWTRDVDLPQEMDADAVQRGRGIFNRADVACGSCHVGERYTNNQIYDMLGIRGVKTRPLTGIAATAPYFHDGSAKTLRDVLERARNGSMGNTSSLSEGEMQDLTAYLQSL